MQSLAFSRDSIDLYTASQISHAQGATPSARAEILHTGGDEKPDINFAWPYMHDFCFQSCMNYHSYIIFQSSYRELAVQRLTKRWLKINLILAKHLKTS